MAKRTQFLDLLYNSRVSEPTWSGGVAPVCRTNPIFSRRFNGLVAKYLRVYRRERCGPAVRLRKPPKQAVRTGGVFAHRFCKTNPIFRRVFNGQQKTAAGLRKRGSGCRKCGCTESQYPTAGGKARSAETGRIDQRCRIFTTARSACAVMLFPPASVGQRQSGLRITVRLQRR